MESSARPEAADDVLHEAPNGCCHIMDHAIMPETQCIVIHLDWREDPNLHEKNCHFLITFIFMPLLYSTRRGQKGCRNRQKLEGNADRAVPARHIREQIESQAQVLVTQMNGKQRRRRLNTKRHS